jgi:hypothetical protein
MEKLGCTFHLVQYFEECSPSVIVNCEFTFWHSSDIRNTRIFQRCSKRSIFKYFEQTPA